MVSFPPGGVGNRHLVTNPPGVGGNCRPQGGADMSRGGGGTCNRGCFVVCLQFVLWFDGRHHLRHVSLDVKAHIILEGSFVIKSKPFVRRCVVLAFNPNAKHKMGYVRVPTS